MNLTFDAPPTCAEMMRSKAFVRLIAGPVGSGKTTSCIFEMLRRAIEQSPGDDGFRYTRFAIVRQTLSQLKDTVLKDIVSWLGALATYKVSEKVIHIAFGDVRSEWLLIPLDDPEDQRRLLSMQLTGAWMSEAIEMSVDIVPPLTGRLGRYPSGKLGAPTWFGLIADTNMPTEGSEWHKLMDVQTPANWTIHIQPGGLDADAENLNWLTQTDKTLKLPLNHPDRLAQGRMYYERLSTSYSPDWVRRYVHAKYGNDPSGSAVHRETFRRSFHVVEELNPHPGLPLMIGQDFGRNPCAILCQLDPRGRLLVLEELISEDMGLELHINVALRPAIMSQRYAGMTSFMIGDPAGRQRSSSYEENSYDLVKREGFMAYPAPTNEIDARLRAVDALLLAQRDGGPSLLIDGTRCPTLVRAMGGMYRFAKKRDGDLQPKPEKKHPWSDVTDALQYVALSVHGGLTNYIGRRMSRERDAMNTPRVPITPRAWT
jgi:hypothetical protein